MSYRENANENKNGITYNYITSQNPEPQLTNDTEDPRNPAARSGLGGRGMQNEITTFKGSLAVS